MTEKDFVKEYKYIITKAIMDYHVSSKMDKYSSRDLASAFCDLALEEFRQYQKIVGHDKIPDFKEFFSYATRFHWNIDRPGDFPDETSE
jgi:hypothetical protein